MILTEVKHHDVTDLHVIGLKRAKFAKSACWLPSTILELAERLPLRGA